MEQPLRRTFTRFGMTILLVAAAGAYGIAASFPLRVSANRRYLEDRDGVPFLYQADTPWLWILGGDTDPGEYMEVVRAVAGGLKETAPHQLMTAHAGSPMSAMQVYANEPWLDVNCTYTYSPDVTSVGRPQFHVYAAYLADYNRAPVKPFVLLETAYE